MNTFMIYQSIEEFEPEISQEEIETIMQEVEEES